MKNYLYISLLFLFLNNSLLAQKTFEGIINYKVSVEAEETTLLNSLLPESYKYFIKDHKSKLIIKGGLFEAFMNEALILPDEDAAYILKHSTKTAWFISTLKDGEEMGEMEVGIDDINIVKTNQTDVIAGLSCRLYQVFVKNGNTKLANEVWVSSKYKLNIPEFDKRLAVPSLVYPGLNGLPLKMKLTMVDNDFTFTMVLTATSVKPESLGESLFELPAQYEVRPFSEFKQGF